MTNPTPRIVSRAGVNTAQSFFEAQGCYFQEVALQNDFGKDAYIDLADKGAPGFLCAAVQIKSGNKYKASNGEYLIPLDRHADNWRNSTVPVFGLVFDADDCLLRWIDITGYLRDNPHMQSGSIRISRDSVLDCTTLQTSFKAALTRYAAGGFGGLMLNLQSTGQLQINAVYDAWALGRFDPKYLLILRRFIMDLEPEPLRRAIFLLSHAGEHPNIFWNTDPVKGNWISPAIAKSILPSFRWSPEEIAHMISAVHYSDWGYSTLGECVDVLFHEDPNIIAKLHIAIKLLLNHPEDEYPIRAASIALSHSRDKEKELSVLMDSFPTLAEHEWFEGVAEMVKETGHFSLYY